MNRLGLWMVVASLVGCGAAPLEDPGGDPPDTHEDGGTPPVTLDPDAGPGEVPDAGPPEPPVVLPATCPLGPDAQQLLDQIVERLTIDALWAGENSAWLHQGFALNLPGTDEAFHIGSVSLAMSCERQLWYDPYCESGDDGGGISPGGGTPPPATGFSATHNRCLRLGCGGRGLYLAQVYMTEKPRTDPSDAHAITYEMSTVPGVATWDPNPTMLWSMRNVSSSEVHVHGNIDRRVRALLAGGEELDLTHVGTVQTVMRSGALTGLELSVLCPELSENVLDVELSMLPSGAVTGTLKDGAVTLATWAGNAHETVRMTWLGSCGE